MSERQWAQGLNISQERIEEWSRELPSGQSLLHWCLINGKIHEQDYLSWAARTYQRASLSRTFFSLLPTPRERLKELLQDGPWSPSCLPVHEWDEITFVACSEEPPPLDPTRFQVVLASPLQLSSLWTQLHEPEASVEKIEETNKTPAARVETLEGATRQEPAVTPVVSPRPAGATLSMEELLNTPVESADGPLGLSVPVESADGPLGLSLKSEPTAAAPAAPEGIVINFSEEPPVRPDSLQTRAVGSAQPGNMIAFPPAPAEAKRAKPPTAEEEERYQNVLSRLPSGFEQGMILNFANNQLRPARWSDNWSFKDSTEPVPLIQPSIFKIVHDSLLPYHGYVVKSAANDLFFANSNGGKLPRHVTLVPITLERRLVGMILATASTDMSDDEHLIQLEKLSLEFSSSYLRASQKAS